MTTTAKFWSKLTAAQAQKTVPRVISSGQGGHLEIGGKSYLNFCSSHYLGFAEEPRLKKAAQNAIEQHGLRTGRPCRPHTDSACSVTSEGSA